MDNSTFTEDLTLEQGEIDDLWHNINSSPSDYVSYWISIASFTFAVLGSISNLMTVIVLSRLSTQLSTFIYLTGLSLSDMITCMSVMITHLIDFLVQICRSTSIIIFLRYVEIILGALAAGSRVLSFWISTAVTMDRWILICYPIYGKKFCTLKHARCITRTLFIIAVIYTIPLLLEYEIIQMPSVYQMIHFDNSSVPLLDDKVLQNSMMVNKGYSDLAKRRLYRWAYLFFNAIFVYTLPTILIVCFNLHLIFALRRVKARTKRLKLRTPANKSAANRSNQSKYSVTMMVIIMVFTLLICRSPTIVLWILWSFELTIKIFFDSASSSGVRRFHNISNLIAIINAATNFLPFCVFGQLFRAECLNIYCCRKATNEQFSHQSKRNIQDKSLRINNNEQQPIISLNNHSEKPLSETTLASNRATICSQTTIVKLDHLPPYSTIPEQQHSETPSVTIPLLNETVNL